MVSGYAAEELLREWLFASLMKGYFVKFIADGFHAKHNSSARRANFSAKLKRASPSLVQAYSLEVFCTCVA